MRMTKEEEARAFEADDRIYHRKEKKEMIIKAKFIVTDDKGGKDTIILVGSANINTIADAKPFWEIESAINSLNGRVRCHIELNEEEK